MAATTPGGVFLRLWHPVTRAETGVAVWHVDEVARWAERATELHREAAAPLPGIALWRGSEQPGDSLGVAVARDGWAIVHTDEEFRQRVTRRRDGRRGPARSVRFDDVLEIPPACFIDRELAMRAVAQWMATRALLDEAGFSDDLTGG